MRIRLDRLYEKAKARPYGYITKVLSRGIVDGEFLIISSHDYAALHREFNPRLKRKPGLGDVVEKLIKPFARLSDKLLGTSLAKCKPCQQRKEKLNKLGEKLLS